MQIGDKIYVFAKRGERIGTTTIVGETRVSWLVSDYEVKPEEANGHWSVTKISKKDLAAGLLHGYKATLQEAEDKIWVSENRWKIQQAVSGVDSASVLRQIAELVGFKEA